MGFVQERMKKWKYQSLSRVQLFATPRTVALQAPLSMEFSRQEHWSGSPFLPPGDLLDPGIEPKSPALTGGFFATEASREAPATLLTCRPITLWPAFNFPSSKRLVCFSAYLTPMSMVVWNPLVLAYTEIRTLTEKEHLHRDSANSFAEGTTKK